MALLTYRRLILLTFISGLVSFSSGVDVIIPHTGANEIRQTPPVVKLAPADLNMNVGGPQLGRFQEDEYSWIYGGVKNTSQFVMDNAVIGGAEEKNEPMYKSQRYGTTPNPWGYDIPLSRPGTYGCTIHFAELDSEAFKLGARVFDLSVYSDDSPKTTFENIDLYNETNGAMFTVVTKTVPKFIVRRTLKIRVQKKPSSKLAAFISGITCERNGELPDGVLAISAPENGFEPPGYEPIGAVFPSGPLIKENKLYINNGGEATGNFLSDNPAYLHSLNSDVLNKKDQVIGGTDKENQVALRSCRYGVDSDFSYQIPMEKSGYYKCTLHFAELLPNAKIGTRVFHIQVQNQIYRDFDVMKSTKNALFTATVRSFEKLIVSDFMSIKLIKVKGNPFLNAVTCELSEPLEIGAARRLLALGLAVPPSPTPATSSGSVPIAVPPAVTTPKAKVSPVSTPASSSKNVSVPVTPPKSSSSPQVSPVATVTPPQKTPLAIPSGTAVPTENNSSKVAPSLSPVAVPSISGTPSADVNPNLLADLNVDQPVDISSIESKLTYKLELEVAKDTNVTDELKTEIKKTLATGSSVQLPKWSLTSFKNQVAVRRYRHIYRFRSTSRALTTAEETAFDVTVNAIVAKDKASEVNTTIANYLTSGKGTAELQKKYPGSKLTLLEAVSNSAVAAPPKQGSNTGVIIAAVVGSLLGILILVAFIAFFIVGRHNQNSSQQSTYLDSDGAAPSSSVHSESPQSTDSRATGADMPLERDDYGRGPSGRLP